MRSRSLTSRPIAAHMHVRVHVVVVTCEHVYVTAFSHVGPPVLIHDVRPPPLLLMAAGST